MESFMKVIVQFIWYVVTQFLLFLYWVQHFDVDSAFILSTDQQGFLQQKARFDVFFVDSKNKLLNKESSWVVGDLTLHDAHLTSCPVTTLYCDI